MKVLNVLLLFGAVTLSSITNASAQTAQDLVVDLQEAHSRLIITGDSASRLYDSLLIMETQRFGEIEKNGKNIQCIKVIKTKDVQCSITLHPNGEAVRNF